MRALARPYRAGARLQVRLDLDRFESLCSGRSRPDAPGARLRLLWLSFLAALSSVPSEWLPCHDAIVAEGQIIATY